MAQDKDGGPAFPTPAGFDNFQGMKLRDWFAGQAVQYFLNEDTSVATVIKSLGMTQEEYVAAGHPYWQYAANMAYEVADAMLKAREAQPCSEKH